jgi:hypothetical protein
MPARETGDWKAYAKWSSVSRAGVAASSPVQEREVATSSRAPMGSTTATSR